MRSYIFTNKERMLINSFLTGKIPRNDRALSVIVARMRGFLDLQGDVELYTTLNKAITANTA